MKQKKTMKNGLGLLILISIVILSQQVIATDLNYTNTIVTLGGNYTGYDNIYIINSTITINSSIKYLYLQANDKLIVDNNSEINGDYAGADGGSGGNSNGNNGINGGWGSGGGNGGQKGIICGGSQWEAAGGGGGGGYNGVGGAGATGNKYSDCGSDYGGGGTGGSSTATIGFFYGSGGGAGGGHYPSGDIGKTGGSGGGAVKLEAYNVTINGNISVNGKYGNGDSGDLICGGGGGGSGGTIIINTSITNYSKSKIEINGGDGGDGCDYDFTGGSGGGGSGGRFIIYAHTIINTSATITKNGGAAGASHTYSAGAGAEGSVNYQTQTAYTNTITSTTTNPTTPIYNNNVTLRVNATGNNITGAIWNLKMPNGTVIINNNVSNSCTNKLIVDESVKEVYCESETITTQTGTGTIGTWSWNVTITDQLWQNTTEQKEFTITDPYKPTINITTPSTIINYGYTGENKTIKFIANSTILDKCWYSYNGTNNSITTCNNATETTIYITQVYNVNNITIYANDTLGSTNPTTLSYTHTEYNCLSNYFSNCVAWYTFGGLTPSCSTSSGGLDVNYKYTAGGSSLNTINCALSGYIDYTSTYDISDGNKTFTLTERALDLYFRLPNSTLQNVSGYWSNGNRTQNFSANHLQIGTNELTEDKKLAIYFAYNQSNIMNYTQFYELNTDWIGSTSENITLLINTTKNKVYFSVKDGSGNPVDDALVKILASNPVTGTNYSLIGQRLSGSSEGTGLTYFYIEPELHLYIITSKDGYTTVTKEVNINTVDYTYSNPFPIRIDANNIINQNQITLTTYSYYSTNQSTIPIRVYAPSRGNITFNTSYNSQQYQIVLDSSKIGEYNLTKGLQYCSSCTTDLVLYIYADGVLTRNYTIKYKTTSDLISTPSGLNSDITRKGAWIGLILLTGIVGLLLGKNEGIMSTGNIGKAVFITGCLALPIIFIGEFKFMPVVIIAYGIGSILKKWISE